MISSRVKYQVFVFIKMNKSKSCYLANSMKSLLVQDSAKKMHKWILLYLKTCILKKNVFFIFKVKYQYVLGIQLTVQKYLLKNIYSNAKLDFAVSRRRL